MSGRGRGRNINKPAWMSRQENQADALNKPPLSSNIKVEPDLPPSSNSNSNHSNSNSNHNSGNSNHNNSNHNSNHNNHNNNSNYNAPFKQPSQHNDSRSPPRDPFGRSTRQRPGDDSYRSRGGGGRRGGSPPRNHRPNPVPRRRPTEIHFTNQAEERDWLQERRKKRQSRKTLFDVPPTPQQLLEEAALSQSTFTEKRVQNQPQQTRHARRLYIGQLPADVSEAEVHSFFRSCIRKAWAGEDPPEEEDPILSVYINRERRFAFVEYRTMEVCSACLALDGIDILGRGKVKVKRPNDFNPALVSEVNETTVKLDVSRLGIVSGSVPDGANKIFIGGLPYHLTESQVLELLSAFGVVRAFHLVKADANAITSKGYCFVEYADSNVTPIAIMGLNGMDMGGGKVLSARMASARVAPGETPIPEVPSVHVGNTMDNVGVDVEALLSVALGGGALPPPTSQPPSMSHDVNQLASAALDAAFGKQPVQTNVLVLLNMVMDEDLATEQDHRDLLEEVQGECAKYGNLRSIKIPRMVDNVNPSAIRKVFLEYATVHDAVSAERELVGRKFGPNVVETSFFDQQDYTDTKLS